MKPYIQTFLTRRYSATPKRRRTNVGDRERKFSIHDKIYMYKMFSGDFVSLCWIIGHENMMFK